MRFANDMSTIAILVYQVAWLCQNDGCSLVLLRFMLRTNVFMVCCQRLVKVELNDSKLLIRKIDL